MISSGPTTLTELDQYFKENGCRLIVNRFQLNADDRIAGEQIEVTVHASGFKLTEMVNMTPTEDAKNFDKILKEAIESGS